LSYGQGDASYRAAGGAEGIRALVEAFYAEMDRLPETRRIRDMHPPDLALSIEKLATFLCGWLGGPRTYDAQFGRISIPGAHSHLGIGAAERDAWLLCMQRAIASQPYDPAFAAYLLAQLRIPAERIRDACESGRSGAPQA
jgi:hemoglobin